MKTESEGLDPMAGTAAEPVMAAVVRLERLVVEAGGAALRYGWLYRPGATEILAEPVRKRQFPVVGGGAGHTSWLHLDDAASATVLAIEQRAQGAFNVVDDEPAPVHDWLPHLAQVAGAKPPPRMPAWLARPFAGSAGVLMMTEGRGFSNAKAKRQLGWQPSHPSWRQGFAEDAA
ncbi:NAD-dependent epimerase/dehydratase family protein [Agrococcus baldri]|uniref:NAD-dependent epimerase/dehydratase family protein n=1 Tax=Agrococcus baldri TaxID=153730 RepID=UPI0026AD9834|nr:NAD(P)-dependent oxidoreductase [Agrococcus baldri]